MLKSIKNFINFFCIVIFFSIFSAEGPQEQSYSSGIKTLQKNFIADEIQCAYPQAGFNKLIKYLNSLKNIETFNIDKLQEAIQYLKKLEESNTDENIELMITATIKKIENIIESQKYEFPPDVSGIILDYLGSYDFVESFSKRLNFYAYDFENKIIEIELNGNNLNVFVLNSSAMAHRSIYKLTYFLNSKGEKVECLFFNMSMINKYLMSPNKKFVSYWFYIKSQYRDFTIDHGIHSWSADSNFLAIIKEDLKNLYIVNVNNENKYHFLMFNGNTDLTSLAWSSNNKMIACGLGDGRIKIKKIGKILPQKLKSEHSIEKIISIIWSPDNFLLATTSQNQLYIWQIDFKKIIKSFDGTFKNVCWSKCGRYIAYTDNFGTIFIWDFYLKKETILVHPQKDICAMSWALDSPRLAVAFTDNYFKVYDSTQLV